MEKRGISLQSIHPGPRLRSCLCLAVLSASTLILGVSPSLAAGLDPGEAQQAAAQTPTEAAPAVGSKPQSAQSLQRQKELADDTAKLLALANELKAEMDKSTKDTLSLNVVKKADQIERLAHKVRAEMKASIGN